MDLEPSNVASWHECEVGVCASDVGYMLESGPKLFILIRRGSAVDRSPQKKGAFNSVASQVEGPRPHFYGVNARHRSLLGDESLRLGRIGEPGEESSWIVETVDERPADPGRVLRSDENFDDMRGRRH